MRLTGVHSLKDADELAGSALYADYFVQEDEDDFTGWTVLDQNKKPVGEVTDLEDIPGNTCLWVRKADGAEVLLPFHEDLLLEADSEKQILTLQIPEGILDL